jgi:hypothetical protein
MNGIPLGMHRSVADVAPPVSHPGGMRPFGGGLHSDGMQVLLGYGISTERCIPPGCRHSVFIARSAFKQLNKNKF